MSFCFACLAPHGWLTIPLLCGEEGALAERTQAAMRELGLRMAAARPETIIIVTPHGTMVEGAVSLLNTARVTGDTRDLPWAEGSQNSFRLEFEVDTELNAAIVEACARRDVPALRITNQTSFSPLLMDFACLIPLWHTAAALWPRPKVVIACPDRGARAVSGEACQAFGRAVRDAVQASGRRAAFLASGDLGHAHDPSHEYGLDAASAEFDALVVEAMTANDLDRLAAVDPAWLARAKTDAYGPLMALRGALEGCPWACDTLSYEVPLYFGMACAAWGPEPAPAGSSTF